MTRNLKALGLALLAICALGAVAAQGASAAVEHEFHSDGEKTVITGEAIGANHKFAVGTAGTVECEIAEFEGTQVGAPADPKNPKPPYTSDTQTIIPFYDQCTFGGKPATVSFGHCAYVFDSDTTPGNPDKGEHANVEIECSGGTEIEIDTSLCTITVGPQTIKHAVQYKNDTPSSVEVITTAKEVVVGKKKTTESQTGCVLFPTGAKGTYTGTATSECFRDDGETLEGTAKTTPIYNEGPTTECWVE